MSAHNTPGVARYRELAAAINQATDGVPDNWQSLPEPKRTEYQRRIDAWHRLMAELYGALHSALASAQDGDPAAIDRLVTFLEADVVCHRSGYFKADALKVLGRVELDASMRRRLESVVLSAVDGPDRREFRAYARLARQLESSGLTSELRSRLSSDDSRTRRHAAWALEATK